LAAPVRLSQSKPTGIAPSSMIVGVRCFPTAAVGFNWRRRAIFPASASIYRSSRTARSRFPMRCSPMWRAEGDRARPIARNLFDASRLRYCERGAPLYLRFACGQEAFLRNEHRKWPCIATSIGWADNGLSPVSDCRQSIRSKRANSTPDYGKTAHCKACGPRGGSISMTSKKRLPSPASVFRKRREKPCRLPRKPPRLREWLRAWKQTRAKVRASHRQRWLKDSICGLRAGPQDSCDNGAFVSGDNHLAG
jgi:hypothetical protein